MTHPAEFPTHPTLRHPRTGLPLRAVGWFRGRPMWPVIGGDGTDAPPAAPQRSPMLQRLYEERDQCVAFVDQTVAGANVEGQLRDLSQSEQESLARTRERIQAIDKQIKPLEEFEQLRAAGNAAARTYLPPAAPAAAGAGRTPLGMRVETRAHHYRTRGECIVDQLRAAPRNVGGLSDQDARERLMSAGLTYAGMSDADMLVAEANGQEALNRWIAEDTQIRASQITTTLTGVLPTPIVGEVMSDIDSARPFIESVGAKPLDFAGKTFSRPVITAHTAVGKQTTEGTSTGFGSTALTIGGVTFTKEVWGGWLDVSRQTIDWTSPSAWDALLNDLQEQYAIQTENTAADAFAAAVTAQVEVVGAAGVPGGGDLKAWITALYAAASLSYQGAGRLPDKIWASLDVWAGLGPLIESQVSTNQQPGSSAVGSFVGDLLKLPRVVVPSFPTATLIIGASRWTEVYEERVGLLTAVLPSVFGVQVAYGGYVAYNTLKAGAFAKVVNLVA